jgi:hypothetical protein
MEWLLERARLADFGGPSQQNLDDLHVDQALLTFDFANATQDEGWLYALSHDCEQVHSIVLLPNFKCSVKI